MPITVERLPNEPIIIATMTGKITADCIRDMYRFSAPIVDEIGGPVFRITDARVAESTFSDVVFILAEVAQEMPGSAKDPRVTPVLVGSNEWAKLVASSVGQQQYGKLNVPLYEEMDEALAYVRAQIQQREQTRPA